MSFQADSPCGHVFSVTTSSHTLHQHGPCRQERRDPELGRRVAVEHPVRGVLGVEAADARVVAADDEVRAAEVPAG